jgi:hypothetical protein
MEAIAVYCGEIFDLSRRSYVVYSCGKEYIFDDGNNQRTMNRDQVYKLDPQIIEDQLIHQD